MDKVHGFERHGKHEHSRIKRKENEPTSNIKLSQGCVTPAQDTHAKLPLEVSAMVLLTWIELWPLGTRHRSHRQ